MDGAGTTVQGTLKFRGAEHRPYYFDVGYDNGHTEVLTFKEALESRAI
jgi:hypothetical protein